MANSSESQIQENLNFRQKCEFAGGVIVGSAGVVAATAGEVWGYVAADVGGALITALVLEKTIESVKAQRQNTNLR